MTELLLSKPIVDASLVNLRKRAEILKNNGLIPRLAIILAGQNQASLTYTRNKKLFCEKFGAICDIIQLPETVSGGSFLDAVRTTSRDPLVHGCLIQLPLPEHLKDLELDTLIPAHKDIDGFHPLNMHALMRDAPASTYFCPCTPKGILGLLEFYNINVSGKHVVIIGRSSIVGKPLAMLLTNKNATVTLCHSKTSDLRSIAHGADILISAIGHARLIDQSFFSTKKQPVVVDVGTNFDSDNKLCGDVDFDAVRDLVSAISPVPGGVGPLTILSLAQNLLQAAENNVK
jgi:methylenetetrahydrofolate dehydrogenase (NADP+)/methenyltetrahydrofolate cyclohydrolase